MERTGTVIASSLKVRAAGSLEAPRVGAVSRGTRLVVTDEQDGWLRIQSPPGWVAARYVALDPLPPPAPAPTFAPFDGPLAHRPRNRAEVVAMFGDPSRGGAYVTDADPTWRARHIVELHGSTAFLPVLAPSYFPVHHDLEPYAREAFRRAEAAAPGYVQRSGTWGFNFRHMRHDPKLPLSYHAWGIAIDVNPDANQAASFEPGGCPRPWSPPWTERWPRGVPQGVVEAFESCAFCWGGYWTDYCDPMHFQWLGPGDVQV